jgi:hypothetical protein
VKLGDSSRADLQAVADLVAVSPSESDYEALEKVVNLDSVVSYMATTSLLDGQDNSDNNYFLLRTKEDPRFRLLPWDLDLTMVAPHGVEDGSLFSYNGLFSRLFHAKRCEHSYADSYWNARNTLRDVALTDHAYELAEIIREAYENDWYLSSGHLTLDEHVGQIAQYFAAAL